MKLTTILLIVLWPATVLLLLRAFACSYTAWATSRSKRFQLMNKIQALTQGTITVYPWKRRILEASILLLLLAYFQDWIILA